MFAVAFPSPQFPVPSPGFKHTARMALQTFESGNEVMATNQLNPSEISELIKNRIDKAQLDAEARNEGMLTSTSDGIVRVHGLAAGMAGDMLELTNNTCALELNLERDPVGEVVLGATVTLRVGDTANTNETG